MLVTMKKLYQPSGWTLPWSWSWKWLWLSERKTLFLHTFILLLPLLVTNVNCELSQDEIFPITSEVVLPQQRIAIPSSNSTTNYKAGLSHSSNTNNNNDNNSHNSHNTDLNAVRRHLFVSSKQARHPPKNRGNSRKNRTSHHSKHPSTTMNKPTRLYNQVRDSRTSTTTSTTSKPTMHPLRVLQTEIATAAKVVSPNTVVSKNKNPKNLTKSGTYERNLGNHRLPLAQIPIRTLPTVSEQLLTDEIKAQLDLINRGVAPDSVVHSRNETRVNFARSNHPDEPMVLVEGRSALQMSDDVGKAGKSISSDGKHSAPFSNYYNTYTDNIAEEDHQYEVTEMVNQYPVEYDSQHPNDEEHAEDQQPGPSSSQQYHQQRLNPEHDGQQEVSHIKTQQQHHHRPHHTNHYHRRPNAKGKRNRPKLNSYYDQNYYAASAQAQTQPERDQEQYFEFKKHKEHEYYENNYHGNDDISMYANKHPHHLHASSYDMQTPSTGPEQQQYYYQQQPTHYQQGAFNHGTGPQHLSTTHITPQIPPTSASSSGSNNIGNPHPPPQPYKGEHDNQTADTIMDRFEVFYSEYKLLTWIGLFGLISLGFVILIVVLYLRNPPTEVVTARSMLNQYLNDPAVLRFLSNILDEQPKRSIRRRKTRTERISQGL